MIKKDDVVQFTEKHKWCGCLGVVTEDKGFDHPRRYMIGIPIRSKGLRISSMMAVILSRSGRPCWWKRRVKNERNNCVLRRVDPGRVYRSYTMKDENEMIICLHGCLNDLCEHNPVAAPIDGKEVRVSDLFGTDKCPYFLERGRKWEDEARHRS